MAAHAAFISAAQYLAEEAKSEVKHEFVDGLVYAMSGASRNHVEITARLSFLLGTALEGGPCRPLDQDTKVWVEGARAYFYPDATVGCPPNFVDDANGVIDNPTVIFEVLSAGTAILDEGAKFAAYRQLASLQDYVTIDSRKLSIKVFSLANGEWVTREYQSDTEGIPIPSLDISLKPKELYRFANFPE